MSRAFWLGVGAYVVPSFAIAYPWHLTVFSPAYRKLAMYRTTSSCRSAFCRC